MAYAEQIKTPTSPAKPMSKPDSGLVEQTGETSKNASSIFVLILLAVTYCYFAIAMTNDPALLSNSASLSLPIVDQTVPILWFYYAAPILLVALFLYFQICMQSYWRGIARLANAEYDGRLDEYLPPSVITTIFLRPWLTRKAQAKVAPSDVARRWPVGLGSWILMAAALCFVPLVLLFFWGRFLVRHDWLGTIVHIALFVFASMAVVYALNEANHAVMRGDKSGVEASDSFYRIVPLMATVGTVLGALLLYLSYGAINGAPRALCRLDPQQSCGIVYAGAGLMESLSYQPVANFNGSEVSVKPGGWASSGDPDEETLDAVAGARLAWSNLRYMQARRAFLVDADLTGSDLRWADLERADLRGAHLIAAKLSGANLKEVKFNRAFLTDAVLDGANLNQSLLTNATLDGAKFVGAKLPDAMLKEAHGINADFQGANLQHANLEKSQLRTSNFNNAVLSVAKMANSDFSGSTFIGANLIASQLENARLNNVRFEGAAAGNRIDLAQRAVLRGANLAQASVHEAKFISADMTEANLVKVRGEHANFTWADLTKANLADARLNKSVFRGAVLVEASLDDAFLAEADFAKANLASASLKNTDLRRSRFALANLEGAVLTGAILREAVLTEARFSSADLAGADLDGAILTRANFDGAKGLSQPQLDRACGSETILPAGLQVLPCK